MKKSQLIYLLSAFLLIALFVGIIPTTTYAVMYFSRNGGGSSLTTYKSTCLLRSYGAFTVSSCINMHKIAGRAWGLQNDAYITYRGGKVNNNCYFTATVVDQTANYPLSPSRKISCSTKWKNYHWYGTAATAYINYDWFQGVIGYKNGSMYHAFPSDSLQAR